MLKGITQAVILLSVLGAILFGAAGRIDWIMAWAYLIIHLSSIIIILFLGDPNTLFVRTHKEEKPKRWDVMLVGLFFFTLPYLSL